MQGYTFIHIFMTAVMLAIIALTAFGVERLLGLNTFFSFLLGIPVALGIVWVVGQVIILFCEPRASEREATDGAPEEDENQEEQAMARRVLSSPAS